MKTETCFFAPNDGTVKATVTGIKPLGEADEDDRPSVVLSTTLMQPESHNRAGDRGWIGDELVVLVTRSWDGHIRHHYDGPTDRYYVGEEVDVKLDPIWRHQQTSLLCAGRLIELIGAEILPHLIPVATDYRPNRANIEFGFREPSYIPEADSVLPEFCREIERYQKLDLPVKVTAVDQSPFRRIQIGDFRPFPCSGAYPRRLRMVGDISITRIVSRGGRLLVRYRAGGHRK